MDYVAPIGQPAGTAYWNRTGGTAGAPVDCKAIEHPMREIVAVITGAGMVPNGNDLTQLRQAITTLIANALPVFTTAPQFDNDTSPATTAFVQRALGNCRAMGGIGANTTLTAADAGGAWTVGGASTITMPLASTVPSGGAFMFRNTNSGSNVTIARQGADQFAFGASSTDTSITLKPGDSIELVSNGVSGWIAIDGTAGIVYSGQFAASALASASGYQKLPSGLIVQWGSVVAPSTAGAAQTISFPIAFPNACRSITATTGQASTTLTSAWIDNLGLASVNLRGSVPNNTIFWMAIGH